MTTVLKILVGQGNVKAVRVNEDPDEISATLAVAAQNQHPFVVFTNSETGRRRASNRGSCRASPESNRQEPGQRSSRVGLLVAYVGRCLLLLREEVQAGRLLITQMLRLELLLRVLA